MGNNVLLTSATDLFPVISVVIPAYNEEAIIDKVIRAVICQCPKDTELEVIVVDDGSNDKTVSEAEKAGAIVLTLAEGAKGGNPAAARNRGAQKARGDPLLFLDADCVPRDGWLETILAAHRVGEIIVGGSLALPPGLSLTARCDYYCGWYLINPRHAAGYVPHHPPPNISVRREQFLGTCGFSEQPPMEYTNEERAWQADLRKRGQRIYFEPRAIAYHYNRPGLWNLMRRNYRWAYTAIESKSQSGSARMAWIYRYPHMLIAASIPLAFIHTVYILRCWLRVGVFEPVLMSPLVLISRFAYMAGLAVGGIRWLRRLRSASTTDTQHHPWWVK